MSSSLQTIILKLQDFWAAHGCLITQPYYTQVGAGTMNPATFLRVLGPEPWNVAYVEPSVRPDDGRYGENPNRFHQHTQFQVILKPDPGNPVELYLQSLEAVGIDPREHDIRLVEDNWEQPAISAWGLGWEIWLDGQEITQFTYFQQVGGVSLEPVAVEMTYGLERILIALNNAAAIWEEPWGQDVTYGEVRQREEYEHSKYYFEIGDVDRLRQMYELFKVEAEACLKAGLVAPAHDYVLKCSHTFNALDCRGAIGVTERQAYYAQMRGMARQVAERYLEQRKELEYPLLKLTKENRPETKASAAGRIAKGPACFLLEVGVEELPVLDLDSALEQLRGSVPKMLEELHLEHGAVRVCGTPRRLAVVVEAVAPRQPDREEQARGPAAERAYGADGTPTPAAIGFAKGKGVGVESLEVREVEGGRYVFAVVKQAGRPALEVLAEALPGLVAGIRFDKSMRWNESGVSFSRPLRWFAALLGEATVEFEYAGVRSGRVTRGLRPYNSAEITIPRAEEYFNLIQSNGIVLEAEERRAMIAREVQKLARSMKGEALMPEELLAEVANLVERPMPLVGSFDKEFLALPEDVLTSVMMKHQRYFPMRKGGKLLAHFVVVRNGDEQGLELVREGNEHVVRARFADAEFFVREDRKHKPEDFRRRLETLTFQKKLGSMLAKNERIEKLTKALTPMLGLSVEESVTAERAARLLKFDLTTKMVTEMTSLHGIMGGTYALENGEQAATAEAIAEQYQPVPRSRAGVATALADRLDSLVGLFAVGLAPSGTKDPFGLRRAAIGVVQPLIEHEIYFDLRSALQAAAGLEPVPVSDEVLGQVEEFVTGRLRVVLLDLGHRYDVVEAVLGAQANNPAGSRRASRQLDAWVRRPDWNTILPGYARCVRILRSAPGGGFDTTEEHRLLNHRQGRGDSPEGAKVDEALLTDPEERALYAALEGSAGFEPASVDEFLTIVTGLVPAINAFFDKVLVMAEDEKVKENRLRLVGLVAGLSRGVADVSRLEGF
jgi:glycyl-tRNA synthetase